MIVIHSFIYLFQTTEVHRHTENIQHTEKKNTQRETDRKKQNTLMKHVVYTILLSHTDSLLAKLTLELCIKVLKLGSPRSTSIFVTLLYFGYPKKNTWYI